MSIGKNERIAKFLDTNPQIIEILRSVSNKFSKMDRTLIYNAIAKRTSLEQLAKIENIDLDDLVAYLKVSLNSSIGQPNEQPDNNARQKTTPENPQMPGFIKNLTEDKIIDIDVREDILSGQDPIDKIKVVISKLGDDNAVRLKNFFEPFPLYNVMGSKGIAHWTEKTDDFYLVYFFKPDRKE